jgi:putative molybdopterin biosynthesis protein
VVLLSGGTSKGTGDLSYRVVDEFGPPGIVAHGVALKPGKPLCLAVATSSHRLRPIPVAVLPGFPTSAVFTFHEFLAPVIRLLAGRPVQDTAMRLARLPARINSERGRTEYVLVGLVSGNDGTPVAFPLGKGSGSVTAFGRADGFLTIPRQREYLDEGETVEVKLLGAGVRPADLVVIGSHCIGLDFIIGGLRERGLTTKFLAVGSTSGLDAVKRGDCDLAGIHLLDPATDTYNRPFLTPGLELIPGYGRLQGLVFRPGDVRFEAKPIGEAIAAALADPGCVLVNRNRGSGTRILIDGLLAGSRPAGFLTESRSLQAVAAAVAQGRADWGIAIEPAAREYNLGFIPLRDERFDFVVATARLNRPAVVAFREVLADPATRDALSKLGFNTGG